ncbi:hypothetical protein ER13_04750 [Brevundimonas sp. EAKA]|jgi:hypothetical protein|uniref:DUF2975 domain-containing protein n=1 Tax=Brevundimonas mediterranea TaxID=74329 RepID=A0A7W6F0Z5_9CAUL|nr:MULTISPECIES: DUF2975 domain-containing protein [Brevundimonas]KDP93015.1 hypothetical protein ER13_04750 [Brevundimonas sp. EAKA]MBB3873460.1 hypothetical protein [Brevundimonas mediterranea]MBU4195389.1 DUF2975 domain-containing protein [Alphaproteobacteria bacterium]VDC48969.1 hypothetical protein BREV_BREV_03398 [Brevundimonas mediterranea]
MKLVGKYSAASALRWLLGFFNVFVMIGAVAAGVLLVASMIIGVDWMDALRDGATDPDGNYELTGRLTLLGAFLACGFTWWIINRLRRILLSVNQGDAFEFANVKRLQAVGFGLLGIQLTALMLSIVAPQAIGQSASDYDFDLGSWLGILVVFILAEVFRQGSAMRDEQLTTV